MVYDLYNKIEGKSLWTNRTNKHPGNCNVRKDLTSGPLNCSNSMDTLGNVKQARNKYKNIVHVSILTLVDDTFAISESGQKSVAVNQFINSHIEIKKLKMYSPDISGKTKCNKIHIGSKSAVCPDIQGLKG